MPATSAGMMKPYSLAEDLPLSREALINAGVARAEAGQHFIADGAEVSCELVDRDAVTDQRREIAAARRLRYVGDVDRHQVHRNAAGDRTALLVDDHLRATHAVDAAGGTEITVGIARRDDGDPGRPPRGPGCAVADVIAAFELPDLHDLHLEVDHLLHRVVG